MSYEEDELQEWEYPEADKHEGSEYATIVCPNCGTDIFDDTEQCPNCRHYILSSELKHRGAKGNWLRRWGLVLVIILLLMLVWEVVSR